MKKSRQVVFTLINSAVIFVLLVITAMLLFTANSENKGLFGQQVRLISGESFSEEIGEKCLVFVSPNDTKGLKEGDFFLYTSQAVSFIAKADKVENTIVTYKNSNGQALSFDAASPSYDFSYAGRITFKSNLLGEFFTAISSKKNLSLTFILIFGIFVISMLSIVISYMLYMKSKYGIFTTDTFLEQKDREDVGEEEPIDVYLPNEKEMSSDPSTDITEEEDEVLAELAMTGELFFEQIQEKKAEQEAKKLQEQQKPAPPAPLTQNPTEIQLQENFEITEKKSEEIPKPRQVDEEARLRQQLSYKKAFDDAVKKSPAPPYYLSDEDIPSIDSIMDSIDRQFSDGEINEGDDDIKIYKS